jgi:signal transduction histidine kinase
MRLAVAVGAALFGAMLIVLPVKDVRWDEITVFVPIVNSIMLVGELIIAALLYAQAMVFRSRALMVLATGFVFTALLLVPHTLTFPGAFTADGLLGAGLSTTAWIAAARRVAFPIFVGLYAVLSRVEPRSSDSITPRSVALSVSGALALAVAVTLLATLGQGMLPPFFVNRTEVVPVTLVTTALVAIGATLVAITLLFRQRKSVLDIWLLVALWAWLIQSILNLPLTARFTIGFYALYIMMVISHLVVLIALIVESNRLYSKLALATAARNRESEAQRMSMDAVAAAISHEVGQPLAAVSLNATAGLNWLTSPRPNVAKAIESLRAINDAGRRSFDILKSIRAMFAKKPGWADNLNLNDLVHETVSSLGTEIAGARVSLELSLDEELPPIMANRVQLQHVVSNLIANAIESLNSTRGRRRHLGIQSSLQDGHVLLEISDNGIGIAQEDTWRIFDAFQATSANGDGIRLSICRTIVEEHGGRIWASRGDQHGATFHVKLPSSRSTAQN